MRLVNAEYGITLELDEDRPTIFVIEEKQMRLKIITELYRQCLGEAGSFVLSADNQTLKIQKMSDILLSPFSIDHNNKKVIAKLYQEIQDYGNENFYDLKQKINSDILVLLDKIMLNVPYNITTAVDLNLVELCKLYNVQLEETGNTLIQQLTDYICVMSQLCGCKVFVLLNFTMYLSGEDLKYLYEFSAYQKIYLLLIEYSMPVLIANEKGCILDKDGCIIEIREDNLQHLPGVTFGENQSGFEV